MRKNKKHDFEFRLKIVEAVIRGRHTPGSISRKAGIRKSMVQRWVSFYRRFGMEGLKPISNFYSADFRLDVVRTMKAESLSLFQASLRFKIPSVSTLLSWVKIYESQGPEGLAKIRKGRSSIMPRKPKRPLTREEQLLEELADLRAENAYLKKLQALIQSESEKDGKRNALAKLLKHAGMARSTFYYHLKELENPDKYDSVKTEIKQIYQLHKGRYGYRRVHLELKNRGYVINHKVVFSLMRELGLKSLIRVRKYVSYRGEQGKIAPNILRRNFRAERPQQKWVTDITEFKVKDQKLYLSPILDLFNGEIISFTLADRPQLKQVIDMVKKVKKQASSTSSTILHSDQGWHYQMKQYQQILKDHNIQISMSRKGNCLDNAVIENFFGTLKSELFYLKKYQSILQLKKEIKEYIHYYNHHRIKSNLNGKSPVKYRALSLNLNHS
jgi:putative transposase